MVLQSDPMPQITRSRKSRNTQTTVALLMYNHIAAILLTSITCLVPAAAAAATQTRTQNPVEEAQRLRAAGDFASAARLLTARVAKNPDDAEAARLLAQTLYWLKDVERASAVYEAALIRHPKDTALRLQYARMLVETRSALRARELLAALV